MTEKIIAAEQSNQQASTRKVLLPFVAFVILTNIIMHLIIALTPETVKIVPQTFLIALESAGYAIWYIAYKNKLQTIRFGAAIAAVVLFTTTTSAFQIHYIFGVKHSINFGWETYALLFPAIGGLLITAGIITTIFNRGWDR